MRTNIQVFFAFF